MVVCVCVCVCVEGTDIKFCYNIMFPSSLDPECMFIATSVEKWGHCSKDTRHDGGHWEPGKPRKGTQVWHFWMMMIIHFWYTCSTCQKSYRLSTIQRLQSGCGRGIPHPATFLDPSTTTYGVRSHGIMWSSHFRSGCIIFMAYRSEKLMMIHPAIYTYSNVPRKKITNAFLFSGATITTCSSGLA